MTFLLNIIPTIIFMVGAFVAYRQFKRDNVKGIVVTAIVTALTMGVYQQIQPSYIPKTGVKSLPLLPTEQTTVPKVEDNLRKPEMSTDERKEHFDKEVLTYDEDIKKILEEK